ncbi:MAG: NADH:ubiquinone oxidoreductase subunit NDUFA12 [Parvularculales bacterium]
MALLVQFFTWWNGQTYGTRFFTWRRGVLVGIDKSGNRYYSEKGKGGRRWVIYNGVSDASKVAPEWHSWLHHGEDVPPSGDCVARPWQKLHQPNMTGTGQAYKPVGSLARSQEQQVMRCGYVPWRPKSQ